MRKQLLNSLWHNVAMTVVLLFLGLEGTFAVDVIYSGAGTTEGIDVGANIKVREGDVFMITATLGAGNNKLAICYKNSGWDAISTCNWPTIAADGTYEYEVTAADAANINTYGGIIRREGATITYAALRHGNTVTGHVAEKWSGSSTGDFDLTDLGSKFAAASIGDVVRFNMTPSGGGDTKIALKVLTGDGWNEDITFVNWVNTERKTVYDVAIADATILSYFHGTYTDQRALRIKGENNTFTSVQLIKPLTFSDDAYPSCEAGTYPYVSLARSLVAGYNTLCLPFTTTPTALGLDGQTVYQLSGGSPSSLTFTSIDAGDEMTANKPYLVKCESAVALTSSFTDLTVASSDAGFTTAGEWTMYGNYDPGYTVENKYIVYGDQVRKGGASNYVNGLRAYFEYSSGGSVKGVSISLDEVDAVSTVEELDEAKGSIYNLAGQHVRKPMRGLYIVGGKKIIMK